MTLKTLTKHDIIVVDNPALIPKHFLFLVLQPLGKFHNFKIFIMGLNNTYDF